MIPRKGSVFGVQCKWEVLVGSTLIVHLNLTHFGLLMALKLHKIHENVIMRHKCNIVRTNVILQNTLTADMVYLVFSVDERPVDHAHILSYNTLSEHATERNYKRKQANLNYN
jgi:hypothetical protein